MYFQQGLLAKPKVGLRHSTPFLQIYIDLTEKRSVIRDQETMDENCFKIGISITEIFEDIPQS